VKEASFISRQVLSGDYYYLNLRPVRDAPGTVVCGGLERCAPQYRIVRSRFRYHSIEYVLAGKGELVINGRRSPLRPGALFYYSPATPHEIVTDPRQPLVKYFVDFCGPRFTRLLTRHPLAGHAPCYSATAARTLDRFEELQRNGRGTAPHTQAICACLLELLILQTTDHALTRDDVESPAHPTYQRYRKQIELRFLDWHTLGDVATACHVNAPYLCRLFKRYSAESPYQLLIRLKMRHAADLLNGDAPLIKQAAQATGFDDPYHFSRVFKKVYGVSPKAFLDSIHRTTPSPSPATHSPPAMLPKAGASSRTPNAPSRGARGAASSDH
jgi:AraC-like DNA-binding protein